MIANPTFELDVSINTNVHSLGPKHVKKKSISAVRLSLNTIRTGFISVGTAIKHYEVA